MVPHTYWTAHRSYTTHDPLQFKAFREFGAGTVQILCVAAVRKVPYKGVSRLISRGTPPAIPPCVRLRRTTRRPETLRLPTFTTPAQIETGLRRAAKRAERAASERAAYHGTDCLVGRAYAAQAACAPEARRLAAVAGTAPAREASDASRRAERLIRAIGRGSIALGVSRILR